MFVVAVVVDTVLLKLLPATGDGGVRGGWAGALVIALGLSLAIVVVIGGIGSTVLRRRDPSLPRPVARDRAATAGLVAGAVALCAGGIVHRPAVQAHRAEIARVVDATLELAERRAPSTADRRTDAVDVRRWSAGVFRACVPVGRPDRAWCAVVRSDGTGVRAREDSDVRPNSAVGAGGDRPESVP